MGFEYDPVKSGANLTKHGIDFEEAQKLWTDQFAAVAKARSDTEPRFALIAQYQDKLWTAFYTEREGTIRLISVRRARENEERIYHEGGGT
jgi:uncharacterized DUF497 family protein